MKIKLSPLILGLFAMPICAQVVNTGSATITIQSGATLYIQSSLSNTGGGTITNNGTLEVTGNLTNDGSSAISGNGLVKFTGTTPSAVTTGGDALSNVEFNKTGADVTLADAMTVTGNVTFGSAGTSKVLLGANNINLAATSTITGANATHYFVATDNGRVVKSMTTPSPYTFPVGDALIYSPLTYATTGGSGAGSVSVGVVNAVHPNKPAASNSFLTRYWKINSTYPASLTGTFDPTDDVVGTVAQIRGANYSGIPIKWNYAGGSNGTNTVIGATPTGISDFTGSVFLNDFTLKAYLQGPFTVNAAGPSNGDTMTTALNYRGILTALALTSPYNPAISVGAIPSADITDWVQVQVVNPSNPSEIYGETSAFIKKNGDIVNLTGAGPVSIPFNQETGSIKIKHRNHLSVRTNSITFNPGTPNVFDFTAGSNIFTIASFLPDNLPVNGGQPQKQVETGKYAMWGGDANGDGIVRYSDGFIFPSTVLPSDALKVFSNVGSNPAGQMVNYNQADCDLNSFTRYSDGFVFPSTVIPSDALNIFSIIGSNPAAQLSTHN